MGRPIGSPRVTHWQGSVWPLRIILRSLVKLVNSTSGLSFSRKTKIPTYIQFNFAVWIQEISARETVIGLFHGLWESFVTMGLCNHLMRIISTCVGNTKKSEIGEDDNYSNWAIINYGV